MHRVGRVLLMFLAISAFLPVSVSSPLPPAPTHALPGPTDKRARQGEMEPVEEQYFSGYVEPRAYPDSTLEPLRRAATFRILDSTRVALGLPHHSSVWWNSIPPPSGPVGVPAAAVCGWYSLGPTNMSGRVTDIAIDAANTKRMFVASVGGVWRSLDGGRRWQCVTLEILDNTFGCVALNPSDPDEVFAGAGDPNRGLGHDTTKADGYGGTGIWRSTSGGEPGSWQMVAPDLVGRIVFRLLVDPGHGHEIYAATNAGVYVGTRAATGVIQWVTLGTFGDPACDLVANFSKTPPVIYAAGYRASRPGIWKYVTAWSQCSNGIPVTSCGGISLTLCEAHPEVLYASIENKSDGSLLGIYRTRSAAEIPSSGYAWETLPKNGPPNWSVESWWFTNVIRVDPVDPDRVLLGAVDLGGTLNAGPGFTSWDDLDHSTAPGYYNPVDYMCAIVHDDVHAIAFLPGDSKTIFVGSDGGVDRCDDITAPSTRRWDSLSHGLNITEVYTLSTQNDRGSIIAAGAQDVGLMVTLGDMAWYGSGTRDFFSVAMNPGNSCQVYGAERRTRSQLTGLNLTLNPVLGTTGYGQQGVLSGGANLPVFPVVGDPVHASQALAAGLISATGKEILLSTTDLTTWSVVPNFTQLGEDEQISCLAIGRSSAFQAYYTGIRGVGSGSPGTRIAATIDGGQHWSFVQANVPNLLPNQIAVDWNDYRRAFVALGGSRGTEGAVIMTTDGGLTWNPLVSSGPVSIAAIPTLGVAIDPFDNKILYAATDLGVFRGRLISATSPSVTWEPFDDGLPRGARCSELSVIHDAGFLCLATFGHGVFQRNLDPSAECSPRRLVVRDNVLDTGWRAAPTVANPEDPIVDPAHPGWFVPGQQVHWWCSTDIRTQGTASVPPQNVVPTPDNVEFESCPIVVSDCPAGTMIDSDPTCDDEAEVHVQVLNRGLLPLTNVRVMALWCSPTPYLPPLPADFWTVTFPQGGPGCGPLSSGSPWRMVSDCRTIPILNPGYPEVAHFHWSLPPEARQHSCVLVLSDAPDDPLVASGQLQVDALAPGDRHVAVRNLHILSCATTAGFIQSVSLFAARNLRIHLDKNRIGGDVYFLLPRMSEDHLKGLRRVSTRLSREALDFARTWSLDDSAIYVPEAEISDVLELPKDVREARIGIVFPPAESLAKPAGKTRLEIEAFEGDRVLGGNTFLVRP